MSKLSPRASVYVEVLPNYAPHLHFVWSSSPQPADVVAAFDDIVDHLNNQMTRVHIVVDVRSDPRFPLGTTLTGAIRAQQHLLMGRWLVIGANWMSEFIGRTITSVGKQNVEWFEDEEGAYIRLQMLIRESRL